MPLTTYTPGEVLTAASLNNNFTFAAASGGLIQLVSTTKSDTFTSASTTFVDITGVSVSITPTSASNKILVLVMLNASNAVGTAAMQVQLLRDATAIGIGDAAGSRTQATADFNIGSSNSMTSGIVSFLDSPATTSATTYKIQGRNTAAGTFYVNRTQADANAATTMRGISSITVFEVTP